MTASGFVLESESTVSNPSNLKAALTGIRNFDMTAHAAKYIEDVHVVIAEKMFVC